MGRSYRPPGGWSSAPGRRGRRLVAFAALLGALAGPAARAEDGAPAPPSFSVDVHRGPVIGSSRVTGFGGAYAGIGEGIEGWFRTPAALANRPRTSTSWFDYDLAFDWLTTPGGNLDFDNDGAVAGRESDFTAFNAGLDLQFGGLGVGLLVTTVAYEVLRDAPGEPSYQAATFDVLLGAAYALKRGEWIVGAGLGIRGLGFDVPGAGPEAVATYAGLGFDLGALWRPPGLPWRVGFALRRPARMERGEDEGAAEGAGFAFPDAVDTPWELTGGFSVQVLPRGGVYNRPFPEGRKDWGTPFAAEDRRYLVLAADVVLTGPTPNEAYSLESLLAGAPRRSGEQPTASVHLGAEGEVWHDRARVRLGVYREPDRTRPERFGRLHGTMSGELRLFDLWIWRLKLTAGFDLAPRYRNLMLGVGFWH